MTEDKNKKTTEKLSKFKEDFVKKSFKYPEARVQSRPAGAEVEQPPVKQEKKSND